MIKLYTAEDLKNILQINERQAKVLMRTEGFPSIKIGREYRVEEQSFIDWVRTTKFVKLDYNKCR